MIDQAHHIHPGTSSTGSLVTHTPVSTTEHHTPDALCGQVERSNRAWEEVEVDSVSRRISGLKRGQRGKTQALPGSIHGMRDVKLTYRKHTVDAREHWEGHLPVPCDTSPKTPRLSLQISPTAFHLCASLSMFPLSML